MLQVNSCAKFKRIVEIFIASTISKMGRFSFGKILRSLAFFCLFRACSSHSEMTRLLMISFDGFRWDYLDVAKAAGRATPNFDQLIAHGVSIAGTGIQNAFVTKTFPNHYTLVTGLYEENHGIVANYFYDPVFKEEFHIDNATARKWWNGTGNATVVPIWVTNEETSHGLIGHERASGVFFWPGSDVDGQRPKHYQPYDKKVNFTDRVDAVVKWFADEDEPINLGLAYFHEPDSTGHTFGPKSKEIVDQIVAMDELVGYLVAKLKENEELFETINLIITSDHGMVEMQDSVYLEDVVNLTLFKSFGVSPVLNLLPNEGKEDIVFDALKTAPNLLVYKKADIPAQFHYTHNRRIMPILVSAVEGYRVCLSRKIWCNITGDHGYNNSLASMHPIFIAHGPAFKKNYTAEPFNTVDVYSLICHILGITPRPNDGSLKNIKHILAGDDDDAGFTSFADHHNALFGFGSCCCCAVLGAIGLVTVISLVCCVGAVRSYVMFSRKRFTTWQKNVPDSMKIIDGDKPLLVSEEEEDIA